MAGRREEKLTDEAKVFATQALACFDPPSVVAKALKDEFGIDVSPQAMEAYDPTKRAGRNCAEKWRLIFFETRETFLRDTAKIPIANRAVRLRALQRMADRAEKQGNLALAQSLYEQAAKEVGDVFTNKTKQEHTHKFKAGAMSDDELAAIAAGSGAGTSPTPRGARVTH